MSKCKLARPDFNTIPTPPLSSLNCVYTTDLDREEGEEHSGGNWPARGDIDAE